MLERYQKILESDEIPYFLEAKSKSDDDYTGRGTEELWHLHDQQLKEGVPSLELKEELADRMLQNCHFCERRCGVDRKREEKGYCGVTESKISSEFLHLGEEDELVPSHTIFFSGCTFGCVFCQNWEISQREGGKDIEPEILANKITGTRAKNVNWVGGDPTPNIPYIIEVLKHLSKPTPQVWNSNMYLTGKSMDILAKLMDLYLTDFKYGNDECAKKLSKVKNYTEIVKRNHLKAEKTGDLIIRHLVLPDHLDCCTKPLLRWIDNNLDDPKVNIMTQYRPTYKAKDHPEINRYLNSHEKREVRRLKREYPHLV